MQIVTQSERSAPQHIPLWFRWVAILGLFVVFCASTVQACHVHPQEAGPGSPDHCPICVAIHSALPAPQHSAQAPVFALQSFLSLKAAHQCSRISILALSDRAPPQLV